MKIESEETVLRELHVLFVNDSPDERELCALRLATLGVDVVAVGSVHEAVTVLELGDTDVVITELALPEVSGYELLGAIRELPAEFGGETPAIAVTSYPDPVERARIQMAGFETYLVKPYSQEQLVGSIAQCAYRVTELRSVRERCHVQVAEQRSLRERLRARQLKLAIQRERHNARYGPATGRVVASERLAMLSARAFAEEELGRTVDEVEIAIFDQRPDGSGDWLICAVGGHEVLIVEVSVDASGRVNVRRQVDG